ncbi:TetR/AcrR family transcriptional regulator [Alteromonas macleodii]|uniref:Bacterial regulatory, tetR family protein n=2 Tax=Gammaproteobacteria TaxID=1236 RepID=A0AB36FLQ3_ALTMA|nr:TetR/AcrR family transcriptional regulator [Alteromonas macleodii]OES24284.1 bacterial regulatory, tetR family protein [Alteromonas macleodii]OES24731.1 bacterial regulatory, tetR family protein [Alteromonas macleodii]OES25776.1 bacterial regulatory, tetR family protein [Alteromonas macleodii]OES39051.1 bacterial regulatory, tetR family protein [Alteromonas macleodii]|tara:strand:+ start:2414 stop:2875 length:462 start_codon:yes stop_codon:yes gene_type:complete
MSTAKHDRQDAIQKATDLFWEKGFHATSMRNIQQAMDMRPGSIYASFGSKEGLFQESLQHYADSSKARLKACVQEASSPLEGLKLFIRDAVVGCRDKAPSGICMLVKTISELTGENEDLLEQAKGLFKEMEQAFMEVLIEAQEQGEIDSSKAP